jgi:hypothetical protein
VESTPGAIGPPWNGGHCRARELTGGRPLAAPVPESSDPGVGGGGRADELNGGVTVGQEAVEGHLIGSIRFGNGGDGGGA